MARHGHASVPLYRRPRAEVFDFCGYNEEKAPCPIRPELAMPLPNSFDDFLNLLAKLKREDLTRLADKDPSARDWATNGPLGEYVARLRRLRDSLTLEEQNDRHQFVPAGPGRCRERPGSGGIGAANRHVSKAELLLEFIPQPGDLAGSQLVGVPAARSGVTL